MRLARKTLGAMRRNAAQMAGVPSRLLGGPAQNLADYRSVVRGLYEFYTRGEVSANSRKAVLDLHCRTNGRSSDRIASLLRRVRPARPPADVKGLLGDFSIAEQHSIVEKIRLDGFFVFERRVPTEVCDEIEQFAAATPAQIEGRDHSEVNRVRFDPSAPISKTYRLAEDDIITNHAMQRLMADPSFVTIAERYLRTLPILSMVNLWWSATFGDSPGADAAQEFHFDFDPPPVWLLFFVYLTDVGPHNGPHIFVRGSHVAGHPASGPLLQRGYVRIPDEDIAIVFGRESVVELYGKRGTVLAVDTRGFHKGNMLTAGHRLMAQLTFSCPPFSGAHGRRPPRPPSVHPALAAAFAAQPNVYERYR